MSDLARIPAKSRMGLAPLPALVKYPMSMFDDADVRLHAAARGLVEIRGGAIVVLVSWKRARTPRPDGRPRTRSDCRVQAQLRGTLGTVKCRDVLSLCIPDTLDDAT